MENAYRIVPPENRYTFFVKTSQFPYRNWEIAKTRNDRDCWTGYNGQRLLCEGRGATRKKRKANELKRGERRREVKKWVVFQSKSSARVRQYSRGARDSIRIHVALALCITGHFWFWPLPREAFFERFHRDAHSACSVCFITQLRCG